MGTGDWNDGMNLVGAGGKGESVWLAWFLADVLKGMAEMSEVSGPAGSESDLSAGPESADRARGGVCLGRGVVSPGDL